MLLCATFPLIWIGGLVTTYRAGMAVPDWPNTFGHNLFLYPLESWLQVFDVLLEHSHRLIGAAVGLIAISLTIALWVSDRRPAGRWLGVAAVAGVCLQGTLGGLRVIQDEILLADVHGCTAPLVFSLAAAMVAYTSPAWRSAGRGVTKGDRHLAALGASPPGEKGDRHLAALGASPLLSVAPATAVLIYVQIVLGAQLRHLTPGQAAGWFTLWMWLHLIVLGLLVLAVVWLLALTRRRFGREPMLVRRGRLLAAVFAVQVVLGTATWVTHYGWPAWFTQSIWAIEYTVVANGPLQALTTTAHVVVGSLTLVSAMSLSLWSRRLVSATR